MRMKMRRKKRKYKGRRAMLGIAAVAMLLLGILFVQGIRLQARAAQYTRRAEELERQIDEEEMRTEASEEMCRYMQTDRYVEEVARDKLGLVYPDEVIFKPEE